MKTKFFKIFTGNCLYFSFPSAVTACLILFVFFQSCKQNKNDEEVVPVETVDKGNERLFKFLVEQGFHEDEITFNDTLFTIDGDIKISRIALEDHYKAAEEGSNSKTTQRRHSFIVSDAYISNIKVFIRTDVSSDWRSALRTAFGKWNNTVLSTKIRFVETTISTEANISVGTYYTADNIIAYAYLPYSDGKPGHELMINTKYNYLSAKDKITTIVHELGHNIGLQHTNQTGGTHIDGTATSDAQSVMNASLMSWTDFSHNDIRAAQILYPAGNRNTRLTPLYRYYRAPHAAHFYTTQFPELRFTYFEHIECFIWDHQSSGSVPIYRYYNSSNSKHMYTTNWNELGAGRYGYAYEGIIGYAYNNHISGTIPIYRYYNPSSGNHHFTKSSVTPSGYYKEGIGWYAFQ